MTETARSPVVVTGLGCVSSAGLGAEAVADALRNANHCVETVDQASGYHHPGSAKNAALVGNISLNDWISPLAARRLSQPSRYAVAAAKMAQENAQYAAADSTELGVVVATAFGPSAYTQRLIDQIVDEGPASASPALFSECVTNAPAGQVAIHCQAQGPNYMIANREAGGLLAVGRACADVSAGRCQAALAGATEELTPLLHAILGAFGALATASGSAEELARPFDRRRNGFLAAEGSTMILAEAEAAARARDVEPLAKIICWGSGFDPTASPAGWGQGADQLARALMRSLVLNDVAPDQVDLVVAGASGSRAGDLLEAQVLHRVWEDRPLPPVVTPKAILGEYTGGQIAAALLVLQGLEPGLCPDFEADPSTGIVPASGPLPHRARRVLVTSFASGGNAAWLVLESP